MERIEHVLNVLMRELRKKKERNFKIIFETFEEEVNKINKIIDNDRISIFLNKFFEHKEKFEDSRLEIEDKLYLFTKEVLFDWEQVKYVEKNITLKISVTAHELLNTTEYIRAYNEP